MRKILSNVPDKKHMIVLGDFNKNMNKISECYSMCHFMKTEYQCTQQIEKNTTREHTRIDLVFSSYEITFVSTIFLSCIISCHDLCSCVENSNKVKNMW